MKNAAVVVGIREIGNHVKQERLGKAIEKAKKLRKHKHLHHNNIYTLMLYKIVILFFSTSVFSSTTQP